MRYTTTFDEEVLFQDQAHGQFGQRLKTETPGISRGVCNKPIQDRNASSD